jgi:hypothetical protein
MAAVTPPGLDPFSGPAPQRGDRLTFRERVDAFITWLIAAVMQFAALAQNVYSNALDAFASAEAAASNRALAEVAAVNAVSVPSTAGTSATSMTVGFGLRSFTLGQLNKTFQLGQQILIGSIANPRNWMSGTLVSFTPGTGEAQVDVTNVDTEAAGTYPTAANWAVSLVGAPAQTSQQQALSFVPVPMAALDMDLTQGEWFKKTINGNSTFTWSNVPVPPYGKTWVLELTITSGLVGFPASIGWAGGLTPTMLTGKTHQIVFSTTDGGTTVRAAVLAGYNA